MSHIHVNAKTALSKQKIKNVNLKPANFETKKYLNVLENALMKTTEKLFQVKYLFTI